MASPFLRAEQPNILFLMVDDLGNDQIKPAHTPNIDRLAAISSEVRGYCNYPWCNASRTSLFAGLLPDTIQVYADFRPFKNFRDRPWMQKVLRESGYRVTGTGKIFHRGASHWNIDDWDHYTYPSQSDPSLTDPKANLMVSGKWVTAFFEDDVELRDQRVTREGLSLLEASLNQEEPWALFVGFAKPHRPLFSHRSDWEANETGNEDDFFDEISGYPTRPFFSPRISLEEARLHRRGYRSCITHIDKQIGQILDRLEEAGQLNQTLIVLTSDHGFGTGQLGLRVMGKVQPHEACNRIPILIHRPGQTAYEDKTDFIVELVDLYPTILDFARASIPANHGQSLRPFLVGDMQIESWQNYARQVVLTNNSTKLYRRIVTPVHTSYRQLHNDRATLFDNISDPAHQHSLTTLYDDPRVESLFDSIPPAPPIAVNSSVEIEETDRYYSISFPTEIFSSYRLIGLNREENAVSPTYLSTTEEMKLVIPANDYTAEIRAQKVSSNGEPIPARIKHINGEIHIQATSEKGNSLFLIESKDLQSWTLLDQRIGKNSTEEWILPIEGPEKFFQVRRKNSQLLTEPLTIQAIDNQSKSFELRFPSKEGDFYALEETINLTDWRAIKYIDGNEEPNSTEILINENSTNKRFYRVRRFLQNPPIIESSTEINPSGDEASISFEKEITVNYRLEGSNDNINWTPLHTTTGNQDGEEIIVENNWSFYRIREEVESQVEEVPISSVAYNSKFNATINFVPEDDMYHQIERKTSDEKYEIVLAPLRPGVSHVKIYDVDPNEEYRVVFYVDEKLEIRR
ncbi:sulfatase-like hydrolase/transferase [Roseibacillus persicicus]|uniref:sulfatase-like hydrolase/transferase n=1 Tax=Roseibacillus persicicus TaxID=454148 RepID=UPI00398B4D30